MPAGAVIDVSWILCALLFFSVLEDSWASLGGDTTRRIHVAIPSVLQAASYRAARRPRKALWQRYCTKSLDLARSLL